MSVDHMNTKNDDLGNRLNYGFKVKDMGMI